MLELYHHGSSVCAAKVRLALAEKGLEWKGHYLDILKGDQFDPAYTKLNSKAVVPTLVHDGLVLQESTVICEYIDEVFPDPPLKSTDAASRARMRLWTKAIDEILHPMCGEITFACSHRHTVARLGTEGLADFLASTPPISVTAGWHERKKVIVKEGLNAPGHRPIAPPLR
jgi:glutathione S-transferase